MKKEYISNSAGQSRSIGNLFAQSLKSGVVLCLRGDLGGGKTTFTQGLARGLGLKARIKSPSFVLLKKYDLPKRESRFKHFYHLDCYRLEKPEEILAIGYQEIIQDPEALIVIEWAERIQKFLPKKRIDIDFEFIGQKRRKISFKNLE